MAIYQRCDETVPALATELLFEFETHKPLTAAGVTIDYVFAFAKEDDRGEPIGNAISHHGNKALGLCRVIKLKDRVLGRADVEITLDGQWWATASREERRALLDHELHHIAIKLDKRGVVKDDFGRPVIELRKHDYDYGWFTVIAARHGDRSIERMQAATLMNEAGQYYWPAFVKRD